MKIQDLKPPVAIPEPEWKRQLVEFWQGADELKKIDLEVTLKMGDAAGARQIIESWQQEVVERRKKKSRKKAKAPKQKFIWGGYWTPGYNFGGTELGGDSGGGDGGGGGESVREASTPDGVSATTKMFLEQDSASTTDIVRDFVDFCVGELGIEAQPRLRLRRDPAWSQRNHSFGQFDPATNELNVSIADRHVMDILRTVAHELVHYHQQEQQDLPADAGETGSEYENEANARAGELMRDYGQAHPELFEPGAVAESSGYIPTKKEKNDPRFKMALSPDVKPGATGLNANRMALKTGPQGEPTLLMKGLKNALREFKETGQLALTEDQDLFEINMSPSNLKKLVRNIDARAGIEFEMIVPDINVEDDGDDLEQDMDMDERVRDIDDVIRFFDDGDYNSARDIRNLREEMYGQYEEWRDEQVYEKWQEEGQDFLRDWIFNNDLFDREEARITATDQITDANPDMPTDSDEFQDLVSNRVDELADDFASDSWASQGEGYDDARESFTEEQRDDFNEGEWLESEGIRYASDVSNEFSIEWPYYRRMGGGDATMDIDSVAEDFSQAVGRPVNASSQYHGGRREPGHYVVEPDGSLEPDDSSDGGLEFVSPPLPLDELISDMQKVRAWAKRRGCYTNDSTGLHMNVSVPGTSTAKLDYVKLALLLGDERVLNEFGRAANTYAKSAMGKIRDILKNKPQAANEVLEKMRGHMEALATKVIHTGNTDKYTSINTKDNYVEFRSPGGDYLDENWELVVPTLMRTVVALDAAMDPEKYREEYQKKLYKLLDSSKQRAASPGVNKLLSMYFASDDEANSREVAVKLAKEILSRKGLEKQVGTPGKQFWWNVQKGNDRIEVVASTEGVALDVAAEEWGLSGADRMPNATATILRPYVEPPAQTDDGRWGIWIGDVDKFTAGDGKIRRWASKEDAELWLKLRRESQPNTRRDLEVREIPDDYQQPSRTETDRPQTYYVYNDQEGRDTSSFQAPSRAAAIDHFRNNWNQTGTFRLKHLGQVIYDPAQPQQFQEPSASRGDLTPRGPGPWEIYRLADGASIRDLDSTNRNGAETEARTALGMRGGAPELYAVRTRSAAALPDIFPDIPAAPQSWYVSVIGQPDTEIEIRSAADAENAAQQAYVARPGVFGGEQRGNIRAARVPVGQITGTALPDLFPEIPRAPAAATDFSQMGSNTTGQHRYQIIRTSDRRQVGEFNADTQAEAEQHAERVLRNAGLDSADYDIRQAPAAAGSPGEFTGEWRIVGPNGEEIHRFGGIGNVQADANRVAIEWLRRNPRHMQAGVEVVPVMAE
jgi:Putative amidoligase enzyme